MKMILILSVLVFSLLAASHAVTPVSDNFSTSSGTFSNWVSVGPVTPRAITRATAANYDYYDGNDAVPLPYSPGMLQTGDGVYNDGGLKLDTVNTNISDEAIGLTIGGTMLKGEQITFSGSFYNNNTSFTDGNAQLWNLTENRLLAETGNIRILDITKAAYTPRDFSVSYTAQASDEGDVLQIRFIDSGSTATARDIFVDNFNLTAVPPGPPLRLMVITN